VIKHAIATVVEGCDLDRAESSQVMGEILDGNVTSSQIASLITALRMKGETEDELFGFASVMRDRCHAIRAPIGAVDLCGTGGDGQGTFNISTAASFVVAAAGVPVAKHGNHSVSSRSGSANAIGAMGIPYDLDPASVERCISETGIGFMMAPVFHKSMKVVMGPRREMGIRSVFNILGPMVNPAGVLRQVIGVYDPALARKMAVTLERLGSERVVVVHGSGMDEITNTGETLIVESNDGCLREYSIFPEDFGMDTVQPREVAGGDPTDNARMMLSILRGERSPRADIVALNAGAGLYVAGRVSSLNEGVDQAMDILRSGEGYPKLQHFALTSIRLENERQALMDPARLVRRRIQPHMLVDRKEELCAHLLDKVRSGESEPFLKSIDRTILSHPTVLTYIMLQRMMDIGGEAMPEEELPNSGILFSQSITESEGISVIGEYKPTSPGTSGPFTPPHIERVVKAFETSGVSAISVLVEPRLFDGGNELFASVRRMTDRPMLFKEFVFSRRQVETARRLGADAILLIAKALSEKTLDDLVNHCLINGIEPLVELHDEQDAIKVRSIPSFDLVDMIGVNSRNLETLEIDLEVLPRMRALLEGRVMVAESGIRSMTDLEMASGYDAVLIGSLFMSCPDIGTTVGEVVSRCRKVCT
jgi:anthranilate phosphoribosyltransferase